MLSSATATRLLHTVSPVHHLKTTPLSIINHPIPGKPFFSRQKKTRSNYNNFSACRALQYSPITEFNLYELLGVDASSDKAQIKEAYRALQKRCHPDIAGPAGHDMAIVLNEAYALLSDPVSRLAYDKELAKVADLQGYTGRPVYSVWMGSQSEQRAVFVDEVKCVGCLKCALFADKTFAVESAYGRARVVAQWADPEHRIQQAIASCPVDCISIVERSNLAALEFIMSKQPRGTVRVGAGNTVGTRTADIFDEVEKFQARYAKHKASTNQSEESEAHTASRISAIQAIQMISNWLYWQTPSADGSPLATQNSQPGSRKHHGRSFKKLKAAAEARKQATATSGRKQLSSDMNEYWVPSALVLPEAMTPGSGSKPESKPKVDLSPTETKKGPRNDEFLRPKEDLGNPIRWGVPMGTAFVAAAVVRLQLGEPVGGLQEHVGGSMLLAIVNSSWLQVILAGVTWYLIGMSVVELVEVLRRK